MPCCLNYYDVIIISWNLNGCFKNWPLSLSVLAFCVCLTLGLTGKIDKERVWERRSIMIIWILFQFNATLCVWNLVCRTWNRLLLGCHPGHLSFILQVASDTLPAPVNLQRWHIQCDMRCSLCGYARPSSAHILGGFPVALSQGHFTYRYNLVLHCIVSNLSRIFLSLKPFMFMLTYQKCVLVCLHKQPSLQS